MISVQHMSSLNVVAYNLYTYVDSKEGWVTMRISERSTWYAGLFVMIGEVGCGWSEVRIMVRGVWEGSGEELEEKMKKRDSVSGKRA